MQRPWMRWSLVAISTLAVLDARAFIDLFSVEPQAAACNEPVTFRVEGTLPDTCYELIGSFAPLWLQDSPGIWLNVHHYVDETCGLMLVPYSAEAEVFVPIGEYSAFALEDVTNVAAPADVFVTTPLSVTCPPVPGSVSEVRAAKVGNTVRFSWNGDPCGQIYRLYADTTPSGSFAAELGSTASVEDGLSVPSFSPWRYFLVAASNSCGDGPKH